MEFHPIVKLGVGILALSPCYSFSPPHICQTRNWRIKQSLPLQSGDFHGDQVSEDDVLGYSIDSFLGGEYDRPLSPDAPAPRPGLDPADVVDRALRSLRRLNDPTDSHGAAVLLRFCLPLDRAERWGDSTGRPMNPWKNLLRASLNPDMLARKLRSSEFSELLDWKTLDVTDGAFSRETDLVGVPSVAVVSAALHFGRGTEPVMIDFTLRRFGGVWLIDSAQKLASDLFASESPTDVDPQR